MASGKKISELDQAGTAADANELAIVQGGKTNRIPLRDDTGAVAALWDFLNPCDVRCATATIASASVLTLNSSPITIVAAPGAGLAVEFIAGSVEIQFNSVAYATNTHLNVITNTATSQQGGTTSSLAASVAAIYKITPFAVTGGATTQIIENQALQVSVLTGDPTAGDSQIVVRVMYRLIAV